MKPINDGGPAFPFPDIVNANGDVQSGCNGMSLRDWFAGQALMTVLRAEYEQQKQDAEANGENAPGILGWWANGGTEDDGFYDYAAAAYGIADAMIRVRQKGHQ